MTIKEIYEEIGYSATKISNEIFGKDITELETRREVTAVIEKYRIMKGKSAHPEMTVDYLYSFVHKLD